MARWWYYTTFKCPDCGTSWTEYDSSAPWCDAGLSGSPVSEEFCTECLTERRIIDELENVD